MQFAPKRNAFCRYMQCNMLLNAVRFGAKRKAKSIKMRMKLRIMRFLFD